VAGVNVPGDVAVLGVDDDTVNCEVAMPSLSSIALSTINAGYEAAAAMDQLIKKHADCTANTVMVKATHVVSRESTNVPVMADAVIIKALEFIKQNANQQIQVSDVAESASVSRRELERKFRKYLNHSVHREIKLAKVQLISKMLLETNESISVIAAKLDFSNAAHLGRYFKDVEGLSPLEYRRKTLCTA
jgi:LacI family transcriptional regulator